MRLDDYELDDNLYWSDEFSFVPIAQSKERSVEGGLVIDTSPLFFGQPVTLQGAWVKRDAVLVLRLMALDGAVRTLTLNDGSELAVMFDIEAGGVEAVLLSPEKNPTAETLYELTLHLITVQPVPVEPDDGD